MNPAAQASLVQAAREGDVRGIELALSQGADVNALGERDFGALHWAVVFGHERAARLLLERGADPNARGQFDMSPLHWAALRGHASLATLLSSRGARVEAKNLYGHTPLHEAANEQTVEALLAAGAAIEARDDAGLTPLFTARTKDVGQALLAKGANLHARARDGRTLFDMLVVNTLEPHGLMLYGRRSAGRLRYDDTVLELVVRNISPEPVDEVAMQVDCPAVMATLPRPLERLQPAQQSAFTFILTRNSGVAEGVYPLVARVSAGERKLGVFELELDSSRKETPADLGMVRLNQAVIKPEQSRWHYLAFAAVPVALVLAFLWSRRKKKSGPGS